MFDLILDTKRANVQDQHAAIEQVSKAMAAMGYDLELSRLILVGLLDYFGSFDTLFTVGHENHYYNRHARLVKLTEKQAKFLNDLRKCISK